MTSRMEELDFTCLILESPKPINASLNGYGAEGKTTYPEKVVKK